MNNGKEANGKRRKHNVWKNGTEQLLASRHSLMLIIIFLIYLDIHKTLDNLKYSILLKKSNKAEIGGHMY